MPGCFNHKHYYSMKKKSAFQSIRRSFQQSGFSKLRVLFGVLLCFAGVTIVLFALGKASAQPRTSTVQPNAPWNRFLAANKIAPWVMEHTANGQKAEFLVVLARSGRSERRGQFANQSRKGPLRLSNPAGEGSNDTGSDPAMAARPQHKLSIFLYR